MVSKMLLTCDSFRSCCFLEPSTSSFEQSVFKVHIFLPNGKFLDVVRPTMLILLSSSWTCLTMIQVLLAKSQEMLLLPDRPLKVSWLWLIKVCMKMYLVSTKSCSLHSPLRLKIWLPSKRQRKQCRDPTLKLCNFLSTFEAKEHPSEKRDRNAYFIQQSSQKYMAIKYCPLCYYKCLNLKSYQQL